MTVITALNSIRLKLSHFVHYSLRALSICQNWPAEPWPDSSDLKWNTLFQRVFAENVLPLKYHLEFDWSGSRVLIKSEIIIATGMDWPASSDKWKAPWVYLVAVGKTNSRKPSRWLSKWPLWALFCGVAMISFLELRTLFLNDTRFLYYLTVYFRMRKSIKMNSHTKYQNMNVKCKNINRALHEKNAFRNLTVSSIPTSFTSLSCGLRRNTSLLLHFFILFSYS